MLLVASSAPTALVFVAAFVVVSSVGYVYRVRSSKRAGADLREEMSLLYTHEGADGENVNGND